MEPQLEPHEFLGLPVDNGGRDKLLELDCSEELIQPLSRRGRGGWNCSAMLLLNQASKTKTGGLPPLPSARAPLASSG